MRRAIEALVVAASALAMAPVHANPLETHLALPALFGHGMVLQRDRSVPVWGVAAPGAVVTVSIDGRHVSTRAGLDGGWRAHLDAMPAGGPHDLLICAGDSLALHDVLVGDVWIAAGQSNMEMPVDGWARVLNASAEVAAAEHPQLRLLQVDHALAYQPQDDIETRGWRACSPANVAAFSAAAYFFGRDLHRELGVPIGIIQASWGGTEIESWTSAQALQRVPELRESIASAQARAAIGSVADARREYQRTFAAWLATIPAADLGNSARPPWSSPVLDQCDWRPMALPCGWENAGLPDLDGVVWFRKKVELPAAWAGHDLELNLGRIDDADTTYFDGTPVGTGAIYDLPRRYCVPARLVRAGPHVIAVRVFDWIGGGGLWGDGWMMKLALSARDSIALAGEWSYQVGMDLRDVAPRPVDPESPNQPAVLWNGMIAPLIPYAIRGAIWYQGEANTARAHLYRTLFPLLIDDWRQRWGQGDFPFLFVQLSNWQDPRPEPGENDWAELREAQALALSRPNTAMAVAIDIGEAQDIHPRNKQEVGRRLALAALRTAYGLPVTASGPCWHSLSIDGPCIRLHFDHIDGGLATRDGGAPRGFAIAGEDRRFRWADARIEGDDVVVRHDQITNPVAVRYAWSANPVCNLTNSAGLPAAPFRTDDWPGTVDLR